MRAARHLDFHHRCLVPMLVLCYVCYADLDACATSISTSPATSQHHHFSLDSDVQQQLNDILRNSTPDRIVPIQPRAPSPATPHAEACHCASFQTQQTSDPPSSITTDKLRTELVASWSLSPTSHTLLHRSCRHLCTCHTLLRRINTSSWPATHTPSSGEHSPAPVAPIPTGTSIASAIAVASHNGARPQLFELPRIRAEQSLPFS